ncbi:MAG: BON domain-containing protein [Gammaproteobacteria bacterium]|nr:BON domain-containing protein [Gammaproteobacteria bacterium]
MRSVLSSLMVILLSTVVSGCVGMGLMSPGHGQSGTVPVISSADADITNRVNSAFVRDSHIPAFDINVKAHNGVVTLSGVVANKKIKNRAVDIAVSVKGVRLVRDQLRLR